MIECIGAEAHECLGYAASRARSLSSVVKVEVANNVIHWTLKRKPDSDLLKAIEHASYACRDPYMGVSFEHVIHVSDASDEPTDDLPRPVSDSEWMDGVITSYMDGHIEIYRTNADSGSIEHKVVINHESTRLGFIVAFGIEWASFAQAMKQALDAAGE